MTAISRRTVLVSSALGAVALGMRQPATAATISSTAVGPTAMRGSLTMQDDSNAEADANSMGRRITFEDIARMPAPGANAPSALHFSSDGKTLTYLFSTDNSLVQALWAYDLATGREWPLLEMPASATPSEADFSFAESMRRERLRQYALGVTDYAWGDSGAVLMARRQSEVLVRAWPDGEWRALQGSHDWIDPQLSPDETRIAFAMEGELHVVDVADATATPRQLTFDASPPDAYGDRPITNGVAEYDAQEELGRLSGFWWTADGSQIVYEQADNSRVTRYPISHPGTPDVRIESHRYPFAGRAITRPRLGVVPAAGGGPTWLSLGDDPNIYLARVDTAPDGLMVVQVLSRDQQHLTLLRIGPLAGTTETLLVDEVKPWVNVSDDLRFIHLPDAAPDDYTILWSSERSGWRELYLYDRGGALLRQLTDHDAFIEAVATVEAAGGWVAFHGWEDSPLERQLFRVPLDGGNVEQVTTAPGTHRCSFAPDKQSFVDLFDAVDSPPAATLHKLDGVEIGRLQANAAPDPLLEELELVPPEFVEVTASDGTILHAAIFRPRDLAAGTKAPVIVSVYGGPGIQRVVNGWTMTSDLRPEALTQQGYLVFTLDNWGTARRGLAFESAVNRNLGDLEVRDQVGGIRWLAANVPEADTERTGIYGWSYGGYMSLMCLARAPQVFKAAAAGGPVTDWAEYDSCYTERYMGTPQENPEGYRGSMVMTHATDITGSLLLIHGLIDENVHFRHTGRLLQESLIPLGIPYEQVVFPEERHHLRREADRVLLERAVGEFFIEKL
jgi:dipeptidyl-peptidase 4